MVGSCHCGAVSVEIDRKPDFVNDCDCSLCGKTGAAWSYFAPEQVTVRGATNSYRRVDREQPGVDVHFCATCGCTSHFATLPHIPQAMAGVNMNLFDRDALPSVEWRYPDGRNWDGASDYGFRRPSEIL